MKSVQTTTATTWRDLVRHASIGGVVILAVAMVAAKTVIPPLAIVMVALLVGSYLSSRPGRAGTIVTLVCGALLLINVVLFGVNDLGAARSFPSWAIAVAGTITSVVLVVATIAVLRSATANEWPRTLGHLASAAVAVCVALNLVLSVTSANASRQAADVAVIARNTKFQPKAMSVPTGRVSFFLDNKDFQLHNFHIEGAGPAVLLNARHSVRRVFDLQPGTYRFECDFHDGMTGTLTVTR